MPPIFPRHTSILLSCLSSNSKLLSLQYSFLIVLPLFCIVSGFNQLLLTLFHFTVPPSSFCHCLTLPMSILSFHLALFPFIALPSRPAIVSHLSCHESAFSSIFHFGSILLPIPPTTCQRLASRLSLHSALVFFIALPSSSHHCSTPTSYLSLCLALYLSLTDLPLLYQNIPA